MIAMYPSKLYSWLLLPLGVIWVCVAFAMMSYYGKAEHAFLWPLQVIGMPVDDFRWDCCQVPDRDGLVTFRQHSFQFRVPPNQIAQVIREPDGQTSVTLSIDRRQFGASEPPGE